MPATRGKPAIPANPTEIRPQRFGHRTNTGNKILRMAPDTRLTTLHTVDLWMHFLAYLQSRGIRNHSRKSEVQQAVVALEQGHNSCVFCGE